jgi:hypothetical protein
MGAFLLCLAAPAAAQIGVRAGVSADPDQFYFGAHYQTRPLVEQLSFRPNAEIGLGDDATVVALNFEFVYHFPTGRDWELYAGGGPALNLIEFNDDTDAEGGFNVLFGVEHTEGLLVEFKVGALDSPELKVGVGWTFR